VVTAHLQSFADHWRVTIGLSDHELAERIRTDAIDILVDLAGTRGTTGFGYSPGSRLRYRLRGWAIPIPQA
jgi:hypothetical protein